MKGENMDIIWAFLAAGSIAAILIIFRKRRKTSAPTDALAYVPEGGGEMKFRCGHRGPAAVIYDVYGTKIPGRFKAGSPNCPDCCLKEMRAVIIRCAACGRPIMPGDVVHLARVHEAKPKWTTHFEGEMVLCNRGDCMAPNVAGRWTGTTIDLLF